MSLPEFSVKQPVLVNMMMIGVFIMGISILGDIPLENFPDTPLNEAVVVVIFPGASPEEMERLVAIPLEEELQDLDDLDYIDTASSEGKTLVNVKYLPGLSDLDDAVLKLKSEVDKVDLPEDAEKPFVLKISTDEVMPVLTIAVGGDFETVALKAVAEELKDRLIELPGVSQVDIEGARDREIWIEVDPAKLHEYGLSFDQVSSVLAAANLNIPGGTVRLGRTEYLLRTMGAFDAVDQINNVVLFSDPNGGVVRVSDLAEVKDTFEELRVEPRLDGKPTVNLLVYKKKDANIIDVVDESKKTTEIFMSPIENADYAFRADMSIDVRESISILGNNALLGIALVAVLLFIFIGFRNALLAAIGIPFTFFMAVVFMYFLGFTLNTLSLFCFVLVLGMIVDDAIIVIENVYRYIEGGMNKIKAAVIGAQEVMWPVVSAVLTTVAAFLPLLLMEGVMGEFLWTMPVIVSIALLASLVEALIILPSHMAEFGKKTKKKSETSPFFNSLLAFYRNLLRFIIKHRYRTALFVFLFSLLSLALVVIGIQTGYLQVQMFGKLDTSTITMHLRLPVSVNLDYTKKIVDQIEERILALPGKPVKSVISTPGQIIDNYQWITNTHVAQFEFDLGSRKERRRKSEEIKELIRKEMEKVAGVVSYNFIQQQDGPPVGMPVEIRITGPEFSKLKQYSEIIKTALADIPGVKDIKDDMEPGKQELRIIPHNDVLTHFNTTVYSVASSIRAAFEGVTATKLRFDGGDEIEVIVKLEEDYRTSMQDLLNYKMMTKRGPVSLKELADVNIEQGWAEIKRRNDKRYITVTANVEEGVTSSDWANRTIAAQFADFSSRRPGYALHFGGEAEEQAESFSSLYRALMIAVMIIYVILGAQFKSFTQPLVVMFAVPFSFIGVFLGLFIMHLPFSLIALISVVALAGVVVNDSLVLVDFINRSREKGMPRDQAMLESGVKRLRPVLLTSVTTIGGLLPMSVGLAGVNPTWQPMAICISWGLAFATLLTLLVIPSFYGIVDDIVTRVFKKSWRREIHDINKIME